MNDENNKSSEVVGSVSSSDTSISSTEGTSSAANTQSVEGAINSINTSNPLLNSSTATNAATNNNVTAMNNAPVSSEINSVNSISESQTKNITENPKTDNVSNSGENKNEDKVAAAPGVINPDIIPENVNSTIIDPAATVINPTAVSSDNSIVNTEKVKEPSNKILFVFVIIIIGFVFFMDDITDMFTEDNFVFRNGGSSANISSSNLVNGYIEIGSQNSFIKIDDVKFYNFKKSMEGIITFDYTSESNIRDSKELDIYIVIYDGSGNVVHKELFNVNGKINKDDIKQYSVKVDNNAYIDAHFAKAIIFSKEEKEKISNVTCTYENTEEDVSVNYVVVYSFKNNDLNNYKVTKQIISKVSEGKIYEKYNKELLLEKQEISKFKANITEDVNYLSYTVDLTVPENKGITLYYKQGTLPYTIKYKESLKNWTCKNG